MSSGGIRTGGQPCRAVASCGLEESRCAVPTSCEHTARSPALPTRHKVDLTQEQSSEGTGGGEQTGDADLEAGPWPHRKLLCLGTLAPIKMPEVRMTGALICTLDPTIVGKLRFRRMPLGHPRVRPSGSGPPGTRA